MVADVTAKLAALSRARRGRRVTRRRPSSSGTGSHAESLISHARRRGGRTAPASAATVLMRAARTAGTSVDAAATATGAAWPRGRVLCALAAGSPGC